VTTERFIPPELEQKAMMEARAYIVGRLRALPLPDGSKAQDTIWRAVHVINGFHEEVTQLKQRNQVMADRILELQSQIQLYFEVEQ
jgi:hypothetical protein